MTEPLQPQSRPVILFVDDDRRVVDGLSASLRRMRNVWRMEFLCGGAAALSRLGSERVDAIVTDMRMPGTDGEALLTVAQERWPGTLRIVLSGQTAHPVVQRTLGVAHAFLSKPCTVDELRDCLHGLLELAMPLETATRDLVCGVGHLPVQESALSQLRALAQGPSALLPELAACIEQDTVLAGTLLHVASGGFYAQRRSPDGLEHALKTLGAETTLSALLALPAHAPDAPGKRLLHRSRAAGRLLRRMLESEQARLCAALHALGKFVLLARFGAEYAALLERGEFDPTRTLAELEREQFGMSHDVVGAHLLGLWGAPRSVVDAVRSIADPALAAAASPLALALHLASALTAPGGRVDERLLPHPEIADRLSILRAWAADIDRQP